MIPNGNAVPSRKQVSDSGSKRFAINIFSGLCVLCVSVLNYACESQLHLSTQRQKEHKGTPKITILQSEFLVSIALQDYSLVARPARDMLAVKIFQQGNRVFPRHTGKIFE